MVFWNQGFISNGFRDMINFISIVNAMQWFK